MSAREVIVHTKWSGRVNVGPEAADRILSALRAAGWEVVPQRATEAMETACIKASLAFLIAHKIKAIWPWTRNRSHVRGNIQACWTAMLTAAAQETTDGP